MSSIGSHRSVPFNTTDRIQQRMSASNHPKTAATLLERGIRFSSIKADPADISFDQEWDLFAGECGTTIDASTAWPFFNNVMTTEHGGEREFSSMLFSALFQVLGGVLPNPTQVLSNFMLSGRRIGFAREVKRGTHLGFSPFYGTGEASEYDHSCVYIHPPDNSGFECWDVTASVELKMNDTNCKPFVVDARQRVAQEPILEKDHGPLGQALLYTLDTLHCLARRGVLSLSSDTPCSVVLPIVVLAGKRTGQNSSRLCCVDAKLHIPEVAGDGVVYRVERQIPFDDARYAEKGIACYLRALRIGVQKAKAIENQRTHQLSSPSSLCCVKFKFADYEVPVQGLIASPIPHANLVNTTLTVTQGELYTFVSPDEAWIAVLDRASRLVDRDAIVFGCLSRPCHEQLILKVSCAAVHNCLVPPNDCWTALNALASIHDDLKPKIAKVLLACWCSDDRHTLITVMKDARASHSTLSPCKWEMKSLWSAFAQLVRNLLLPLAAVGVIHVDIRSGWTKTYNILGTLNSDGGDLLLIDFESLILAKKAKSIKENGSAVSMRVLTDRVGKQSAGQYVMWQVLWMAYVWFTGLRQLRPEEELIFREFAANVAEGTWDKALEELMKHDVAQSLSISSPTADEVGTLLNNLSAVFDPS
jgi:hypothetical protein